CDETLDVDDLPVELEPVATGEPAAAAVQSAGLAGLVGRPLEEIERLFIGETLKLTGGNREQAAEMLGIGERTLYRKIKEFQLS
ncbi:MAG: helix-turn-helix domain-containing protein, partial [Planctomycetia bacterium]